MKSLPFTNKLSIRLKSYYQLSNLRNIHKDSRTFIIGSGPSLRIEDLDKLKYKITFACNKLYIAFEKTDWRPNYLSVIDNLVAKNCTDKLKSLPIKKVFSSVDMPCFQDSHDII